jgi:hypothetical protein
MLALVILVTATHQMCGILGWFTSLLAPSSFLCARARQLQSNRMHPFPPCCYSLMPKLIDRPCNRYHDYTWRAAANTLSPESIASIRELSASIDDAIRDSGWQRLMFLCLSQLFNDDAFASGPAASCVCAAEAPRTASHSTDKQCGMTTSALCSAWLDTYPEALLSSTSPLLTPTRD